MFPSLLSVGFTVYGSDDHRPLTFLPGLQCELPRHPQLHGREALSKIGCHITAISATALQIQVTAPIRATPF